MPTPFSGQTVAVFGLAKSGLSAIRLLEAQGAKVRAVDGKSASELGEVAAELSRRGIELRAPSNQAFEGVKLLVVSPGVPLALPEIQAARAAGIEVIGEVELAYRLLPNKAPLVGITGTNGKSTTTALTGELFKQAQIRTFVGGNLGLPLAESPLTSPPYDAHVVELSSFQLEGISTLRATASAILNLTPDHLDRYPSQAEYGAAKARVWMNAQPGDVAVVNADDPAVMALAEGCKVPVYGFSVQPGGFMPKRLAGMAIPDAGGFRFSWTGHEDDHFVLRNRALRGAHNLQNAMAAALLAFHSGVDVAAIQRGLDSYPGLPHRMELVRTLDGVEWINDSKATNVDSTLVALRAFPKNVWLIAGGKGKGAPYAPMVEESRGRVKGVLTVGKDAPTIAQAFAGAVEVHGCETLDRAVARARELAREGDVVLLSPACASYDQFKNFEDRGDSFKRLVTAL